MENPVLPDTLSLKSSPRLVIRMPYVWSNVDTKNALIASIIPAGIGIASIVKNHPEGKFHRVFQGLPKPKWSQNIHPCVLSTVDLLAVSPLGYASYLVYKNGGGFDYTDTTAALGLYGCTVILAAATIPLMEKRNPKCLFVNSALTFGAAAATAFAFYKIDEQAGYWMIPFTAWSLFYTVFHYQTHKNNIDPENL